MSRTKREDWVGLGLRVLKRSGEAGLTIDRLCKDLGRTKGAFYHHFADAAGLHVAVLDHWEQQFTEALIAACDQQPKGPARHRAVEEMVLKLDLQLEAAVRVWAHRDRTVRARVERVDERRRAYMLSTLEDLGANPSKAREAVEISYALFIGVVMQHPRLDLARYLSLSNTLEAGLLKIGAAPPRPRRTGVRQPRQ